MLLSSHVRMSLAHAHSARHAAGASLARKFSRPTKALLWGLQRWVLRAAGRGEERGRQQRSTGPLSLAHWMGLAERDKCH